TTTGVPVVFHDERFSSVEATDLLSLSGLSRGKRKARTDSLAAQIVLTAWVESIGSQQKHPGALDG
ncbi:MAG: Holliday junction resolvase RuvX, partial [Planctomycetia bacterium]|nr:Holliday junction resolvase RuvX [Planctomycetia bacterium]